MGCIGPELHIRHDRAAQGRGVLPSGAWTNAVNNVVTWEMPHHPCICGRCRFSLQRLVFPWTITMLAGTHVFLRSPSAEGIYDAFAQHA
ncbi:MAG: hypothetical protein CM15mP74_28040 [Halieaceae bacterium]|nr:MAG: hypothetical protein CM15mP74_28040 [Halieaceae bacterium]